MSIISSLAIAIATCRVSSIRLRQSLGKTWRGTSEGQHVLPGALLFRMLRIVSRRCIRALSFSPPSIVVVVSEVATTASSVFDAINTTYERLILRGTTQSTQDSIRTVFTDLKSLLRPGPAARNNKSPRASCLLENRLYRTSSSLGVPSHYSIIQSALRFSGRCAT